MASNPYSDNLNSKQDGITLRDYNHAPSLFLNNNLKFAPKVRFLYHCFFALDPSVGNVLQSLTQKYTTEIGMLVKSADLPRYTAQVETRNKYNRKKNIQTQIQYEPINITFHDDNHGVTTALLEAYYRFYYADAWHGDQPGAYSKLDGDNTFKGSSRHQYRYGLDNNITTPLFKSVQIYTMGRRRFIGYELINPRITSWQHGDFDYQAGSEPAESTMQLQYEAVRYSAGTVSEGSPKGFATLHYDTTPGPLQMGGGGVSNLLGSGGVLDGLESVFGAVGDGSAFSSPQGFLSTAVSAINTYKNAKGLSKDSILQEGINILTSPAGQQTVANTINGVVGAVFPKNTNTKGTTTASPKKVLGGSGVGRQDIGT